MLEIKKRQKLKIGLHNICQLSQSFIKYTVKQNFFYETCTVLNRNIYHVSIQQDIKHQQMLKINLDSNILKDKIRYVQVITKILKQLMFSKNTSTKTTKCLSKYFYSFSMH